ncbi:MAG: carboxy terminal-processing peptidase [Flavobacteriaceae bacterium]
MNRIFTFLFIIFSSFSFSQEEEPIFFCQQIEKLNQIIAQEHFSPKPIDDSLSVGVYTLFLKNLNEQYWFFHKEDMELFEKDKFQLDTYFLEKNCTFINPYISIYSKRITQTIAYLETLKNEPLHYQGTDTINFSDRPKERYFKDLKDSQKSWNKKVRFKILSKLIEEDTLLSTLETNFIKLESDLKDKVINDQICLLNEILNQEGGVDRFIKETFLNAIANYQDPNTQFFNSSDKDYFDTSLSANQLSFGVYSDKNKSGEIEIIYIAPGSVAHKDGTLEEGDIIKNLFSVSTQYNLDTFCISNNDIAYFLNDSKNKQVAFKIKKKDGAIKEVQLTKGLIKSPENLTRGYVIKGAKNMGYINIPSFYTDLESPNGLGVANDVAKELYKLEKENISGLIIDLRFNGGGSIKEVADLTGMFINRGPISIFKGRNNETFTYKDNTKGALFTKPIVIIMNAFSASASEFFAAAMQDYGRAIVVGAPSFGKASSQVILPLSHAVNMGYCKITIQRFYRINGNTNQTTGVIPDVIFPSLYDDIEVREKYLDYVLPNDTIAVAVPYKKSQIKWLDDIVKNSNERVSNNVHFNFIKQTNQRIRKEYFDIDRGYPLTLKNVYEDITNYNSIWSQMNTHFENKNTHIEAANTKAVEALIQYNEDEKTVNRDILKNIAEDIFIEEAFTILIDYLNYNR